MHARLLAEAIGTFALVFSGCGAIVVDGLAGGALGVVGIAAVFGMVVLAMIHALGDVSGAHFNPAVSLAFWRAGRLPGRDAARYAAAQCAGALAAAAALRLLFPEHATLGATIPAGSMLQSFGLEAILSFLLIMVILGVAHGAREQGLMAGVAVGGTVALEAMFGGPVSGASMNPARSLGPALVSGRVEELWIYLLAPVLGMLAAIPLCRMLRPHGGCCAGTCTIPGEA